MFMLRSEMDEKIPIVTNALLWTALYIVMAGVINSKAYGVRREALRTSIIIHKISNDDIEGVLSKTILIFSNQLLYRIPKVSCGLFDFDWKLTFKVEFI